MLAHRIRHTLALLLSFPMYSHAAGLNDTGQTRCYQGTVEISCNTAPAADDGRYGRDAAARSGALVKKGDGAAGFDFTKIANDGRELPATATMGTRAGDWACTRDNATGLTWEVKTPGRGGLRSHWNKYTWFNTNATENGGNAGSARVPNYSSCDDTLPQCNTQAYVAEINSRALCGFTDWRLPTPVELRGIVHYGSGQAGEFDKTYFTTAAGSEPHYFTAATYAADPANVRLVEIGGSADGGGAGHNHSKGEEQYLMLVRGAQPDAPRGTCGAANARADIPESTPAADFVDHGDGTVTHLPTGLMWKRCAEGLSGPQCTGSSIGPGHADGFSWTQALAAAESSTFAGYSDWRLPNVKELASIIETCGYQRAINASVFPGTPFAAGGSVFWTSTMSSFPCCAYLVAFDVGGALPTGSESKLYVRLVRGGLTSADVFDAQNPRFSGPRRRSVRKF